MRNVIAAIAIAIALVSGGVIYGGRHTTSSVVITGSAPASPDPSTGNPGIIDPGAAGAAPVPLPTKPLTVTPLPATQIYIHIAGAVKHPGLYTVPTGTRVAGAIKAAGGSTGDADVDAINLAEKVVDGEKVYIPRKNEGAQQAEPGNTIGKASDIPGDNAPVTSSPSSAHDTPAHGQAVDKIQPGEGKININTASAQELQRLPGVGAATAERIIAYRQHNGGFKKPDDLMDVGGIGDKKMAKLRPYVSVH